LTHSRTQFRTHTCLSPSPSIVIANCFRLLLSQTEGCDRDTTLHHYWPLLQKIPMSCIPPRAHMSWFFKGMLSRRQIENSRMHRAHICALILVASNMNSCILRLMKHQCRTGLMQQPRRGAKTSVWVCKYAYVYAYTCVPCVSAMA
jgi:hypothetical protein